MEPNLEMPINAPNGCDLSNVYSKEDAKYKLSPLQERWQPGMTFGEYFGKCLKAFSYSKKS